MYKKFTSLDKEKLFNSLEKDKSIHKQAMVIQSILNDYLDLNILEFAHYMKEDVYVKGLESGFSLYFQKMDKSNDPNEQSTFPTYCWTTKIDNIQMWQAYGNEDEPKAIMQTIGWKEIDRLTSEHPILFGPVFYLEEFEEIKKILKDLEEEYQVNKLCEIFMNFCKLNYWKDEEEYRMILINEDEFSYIPSNSFKHLLLLNIEPKRVGDSKTRKEISSRNHNKRVIVENKTLHHTKKENAWNTQQ
ncbi:DUF2971 domain-containing protein [Mycoplasma marinum]|uniref:DUF2971 domain-containing protein n=1 Tax=Mycoplasma marinum TaxID=1937190 RepID=A0A4V2NI08_9MOLU|nr:DUF2971 domain-containing protein [Mycoplasma marinum]TCG10978.1 hypothetical protein C4B24_03385 [Mycoplasma marinum]